MCVLDILASILKDAGYEDDEINLLLTRFIEEESTNFLKAINSINQ